MGKRGRVKKTVATVLTYMIVLLFLSPFCIAIIYSLKSDSEIAASPIALPHKLHWENYVEAIQKSNFFVALKNSFLITAIGTILLVLICSMAAYVISRNMKKNKYYNILYYVFQATIMLPFQVIMFPLYKMYFKLNLINTMPGIILVLVAFQMGFDIFLYVGFIKTIPVELEEAAEIDGCNKYQTFFKIIFPLLKPMTATVSVISALGLWNDFQVAQIFAQKDVIKTLPLSQYYFLGQYSVKINMAFAGAILTIIPMLIVFIFMQKYIIKGVTSGAVKG